ncbi:toxin-antitoxin system HicB family antitoxin [Nocardioides caldifontis]|uniref:toxin-antitoxin system HicB family antitoxin n=1 Tax=Nocardioides caldifontis TaxID=2588938 RepID=UPI0011DFA8D8|nr:toxin-antitoxin system HicB family antitoxin [Nocardioides caldifontis]
MDITPYAESLRRDLLAAAEIGGPEMRAGAERMLVALEPSVRLLVLEVLSQAAAEVTAELPSGTVEVRLQGRDPEMVVDLPEPPPPTSAEPADPEDGPVARITLRLPESVKSRAEELASATGHSLNNWIVQAVRAATQRGTTAFDMDVSSIPFSADRPSRRMSGWI